MTSQRLPHPEHQHLVARIDERDLPRQHRSWNGNDQNARQVHSAVDLDDDPIFLSLAWKRGRTAPTAPVGCFRLDLRGLLREGYIRVEPTQPNHVRLRFYHDDDGVIYIQVKQGEPVLPVGTAPLEDTWPTDTGRPASKSPAARAADSAVPTAPARAPVDTGQNRVRGGGLIIRNKDTKAALLHFDRESLRGADLRGASLAGADLLRQDLSGADLRGADLSDADLSRANLQGANLRGADLRNADLIRADLTGALLAGANLADANLSDALFAQADLSSADLSGATLDRSQMDQANRSGIRSDLTTSWPADVTAPEQPVRQIVVD